MPDAVWWLDRLSHELDRIRPHIEFLRRYLDGDAPLPEGAENCREAYKAFQRKSRRNFAELLVDAVVERMIVSGFQVGTENEDDDAARQIWKRNRMGVNSADVHRDMIGLAIGYTCVQADQITKKAVITYERPEQAITDHDPARPDIVRAGLKVYRDDVEGHDVAYVHHLDAGGDGLVTRFVRDTPVNKDGVPVPILTAAGGWKVEDAKSEPTGLRMVPIRPFVNRGGKSEFGTHTDLLDSINWITLQKLVIIAMQAYRQRATKGDLPETDEQGNPINYAELFKPGPGALWHLPEGIDLWESAQTDMSGIREATKDDVRDLAAVTRTPITMLIPDGANQSAEGASAAKEGLVFKSGDRIERAKVAWAETVRLALAIERGVSEDEVDEVEVMFLPPERQSLAEKYSALQMAGTDVPWRYKMTDILGIDGDRVDRMAAERAEDLLLAGLAQPPAAPPAQPAPPAAESAPEPALPPQVDDAGAG